MLLCLHRTAVDMPLLAAALSIPAQRVQGTLKHSATGRAEMLYPGSGCSSHQLQQPTQHNTTHLVYVQLVGVHQLLLQLQRNLCGLA